eukprot:3839392-Pyramimonas_sp.AAC.1
MWPRFIRHRPRARSCPQGGGWDVWGCGSTNEIVGCVGRGGTGFYVKPPITAAIVISSRLTC